jgi:hypothetical protein
MLLQHYHSRKIHIYYNVLGAFVVGANPVMSVKDQKLKAIVIQRDHKEVLVLFQALCPKRGMAAICIVLHGGSG